MKKTHSKISPEALMKDAAFERSEQSRETACCERMDEWHKLVEKISPYGTQPDYAVSTIFKSVASALYKLGQRTAEGKVAPLTKTEVIDLALILSFDFFYTFDSYMWNGQSTDPDNDTAFDEGSSYEDMLEGGERENIISLLMEYLTVGAAKAKEIGSDSYHVWRDQLAWFNFNETADKDIGELTDHLNELVNAAKTLWADLKVANYRPRI